MQVDPRRPLATDLVNDEGYVAERREEYPMPTIERESLFDPRCEYPLPHYGSAFRLDLAAKL